MIQKGNYILLAAIFICLTQPVNAKEEVKNCEDSALLEGASNGDRDAQYLIANCWRANKHDTKALRKAADEGHPIAQFNLGLRYRSLSNYTEAMNWYLKAAEQGHAAALYDIGVMYNLGMGVPKNNSKATDWYLKAAEHGSAAGQFNVGSSYERGDEGVPQNYEKCYVWSSLAAASGHQVARENRDYCAEKITSESIQNGQKEATRLFELIKQNTTQN